MLDALAWPRPLLPFLFAHWKCLVDTFQVAKACSPFIFDNGGRSVIYFLWKVTSSVMPSRIVFFFVVFFEEVEQILTQRK